MKSKIALKLSVYFAAALLVFTLIIGMVFLFLFQRYTIDLNKSQLTQRAVGIAETIAGYAELTDSSRSPAGIIGFHSYLDNLSSIAIADIWVIDRDMNIFTRRPSNYGVPTTKSLPENAESLINDAFSGEIIIGEGFSSLFETNTITICAPITATEGDVIGVVLLHSPISGVNKAVRQGLAVLAISISTALAVSIALSVWFSVYFTGPLSRMKKAALLLADGNYTAKTQVSQNDEIGQLAGVLDILSDKLSQADKKTAQLEKIRRDYVANISHELKTPITVIRGSLEAMCDGVVTNPDMIRDYHMQMLSESIALQRLVGDLLDLSRLQNADLVIETSPVNLCDILSDVSRSAHNLAIKRNIKITTKMSEDDCTVKGDYGRLRQLLMIIIDNAIKFSSDYGSVEMELTKKNKCALRISDHGCGIPEEELPFIFDRFHKVKSPDNASGTGLGLAIAKEIAIKHNISIDVSSIPGQGTVFALVFNDNCQRES